MARKKRRRGHRKNPSHRRSYHRRRRHYRRNPSVGGVVRGIVPFTIKTAIRAVEATGGKVVVRNVRRLVGQRPGTILGSVIEGGTGIVGGAILAAFVNRELGEMFALGGLQAPLETGVNKLAIPYVSDSLADDGFDFSNRLGLVADGDGGGEGGVSGWVPDGSAITNQLAGWVTGMSDRAAA